MKHKSRRVRLARRSAAAVEQRFPKNFLARSACQSRTSIIRLHTRRHSARSQAHLRITCIKLNVICCFEFLPFIIRIVTFSRRSTLCCLLRKQLEDHSKDPPEIVLGKELENAFKTCVARSAIQVVHRAASTNMLESLG